MFYIITTIIVLVLTFVGSILSGSSVEEASKEAEEAASPNPPSESLWFKFMVIPLVFLVVVLIIAVYISEY
mgnify:CR=1 FL=1